MGGPVDLRSPGPSLLMDLPAPDPSRLGRGALPAAPRATHRGRAAIAGALVYHAGPMPLTVFVRNVQDLSDDGGFKFRFACDRCGSGVESQYVSSKGNLLKTVVQFFQLFRWPAGYGAREAVEGLDRGLRGKERDAAYERAVHEALVHFEKCAACGQWVCRAQCWNGTFGLCEGCAPSATEAAARRAAELARDRAVTASGPPPLPGGDAAAPAPSASITCPVCQAQTQGGRFCQDCGASLEFRTCRGCDAPATPGAKFCARCGEKL